MKRVFNDMSSNNYIDLYIPSHHRARSSGNVHEHIVKAEEYMGRQLKSEEVVHHEDFNKTNNSKDNLFVFTSQANTSIESMYKDRLIPIRVLSKMAINSNARNANTIAMVLADTKLGLSFRMKMVHGTLLR